MFIISQGRWVLPNNCEHIRPQGYVYYVFSWSFLDTWLSNKHNPFSLSSVRNIMLIVHRWGVLICIQSSKTECPVYSWLRILHQKPLNNLSISGLIRSDTVLMANWEYWDSLLRLIIITKLHHQEMFSKHPLTKFHLLLCWQSLNTIYGLID